MSRAEAEGKSRHGAEVRDRLGWTHFCLVATDIGHGDEGERREGATRAPAGDAPVHGEPSHT